MKANYLNKRSEPVSYIKVQFEVNEKLIRHAIIHLMHIEDVPNPTKKEIIEEIKSVTYNFGKYGYGESINDDDISNYDELREKADAIIEKWFPTFL
jgi:hypothetical protein